MSFNLTRKTDYALVALAALAEPSDNDDGPKPLSARQISERYDLPLPLLMNVLKDLHRGGILCSRRGAGGGYMLCHDPTEVSLLKIVEATEGPVRVALCCDTQHESGQHGGEKHDNGQASEEACTCRIVDKCPITAPMQRFDELVHEFLAGITLRDLIHQDSPVSSVSLTREGAQA